MMAGRVFEGVSLHCVDLGARAGLPTHWRPFERHLTVDAFEPDEQASDQGYRQKDNVTWFPFGLAEHSGSAPFYLTSAPSGSSLFPPNEAVLGRFAPRRYWTVAKTLNLPFLGFSDYLAKHGRPRPELIKADTQGSELGIFSSLKAEDWSDLLAVETEVEFAELYQGQPLFRDVDAFMAQRGFELFDLRTHRNYINCNERSDHYLRTYLDFSGPRSDLSARLLAGDALYIRRFADGLPPDAVRVRKLALIYCIYRFFDHAFELAEQAVATGVMSQEQGDALVHDIRASAPQPGLLQRKSGLVRRLYTGVRHVIALAYRAMGWRLAPRAQRATGWMMRAWPDQ